MRATEIEQTMRNLEVLPKAEFIPDLTDEQLLSLMDSGESLDDICIMSGKSRLEILERSAKVRQAAVEQVKKAFREELRFQQHRRLDRAIKGLMGQVDKGNPFCAKALVAVEQRRSQLFGLDEPTKLIQEVTDPVADLSETERSARIAALLEKAKTKMIESKGKSG